MLHSLVDSKQFKTEAKLSFHRQIIMHEGALACHQWECSDVIFESFGLDDFRSFYERIKESSSLAKILESRLTYQWTLTLQEHPKHDIHPN